MSKSVETQLGILTQQVSDMKEDMKTYFEKDAEEKREIKAETRKNTEFRNKIIGALILVSAIGLSNLAALVVVLAKSI